MKWSAIPAGGKVVLLDDHKASGTENSYTYTPSSPLNLQDDYNSSLHIRSSLPLLQNSMNKFLDFMPFY